MIGDDGVGGTGARAPDCLRCAHLSITWNAAFPYACAVFPGDIYRALPGVAVRNATGLCCPAFCAKAGIKG
ncbi:MAG: hypothetical protein LBS82_04135 [Spirochaetaceae bacterium]|nr:hypothetical protein [Spirochaetaceae bacterium]